MTSVEYRCFTGQPTEQVLHWLTEVNQHIFAFNETAERLAHLFQQQQEALLCLAFQEGKVVGFKLGFKENSITFDSWRGGVLPTARRKGIAMELMRLLHKWCQENDVKVIKTTTNSDNTAMLIVNLKSGFEIVGSFLHRQKRLKVLQEKRLPSETQTNK